MTRHRLVVAAVALPFAGICLAIAGWAYATKNDSASLVLIGAAAYGIGQIFLPRRGGAS